MSTPRGLPYRVMVVCTGNICRSPMAEVVLRQRLRDAGLGERDVVVDSTGTSDEEHGNPLDSRARAVLEAAGYPLDAVAPHRARQVRRHQVGERDLVLAMTTAHRRSLLRLAPDAGDRLALYRSFDPGAGDLSGAALDVADPWYGGPADFQVCLEQVEAAAGGVVAHVRRALGR